MDRLVLIDVANAVYRAFFALPPLRSAAGEPTGAVLGFANMLRKVLREAEADGGAVGVAVAMDPRGGSFRHKLYRDYKAKRDAQPEDLTAQLPVVRELIEAWRIPILEAPDFEADDVIATLTKKAKAPLEVWVVSTDKDLMQLVSKRVTLLDTMKDRRIGPAEVAERFGVGPEQLLDVRALAGDPSDNIPGVKGIGEKGAAKLIETWGTLDALLENIAQVSPARARGALEAHAEDARLSKRLASLRFDAPVGAKLSQLARRPPDREKLRALYTRLGFTRLLDDLAEGGATAAPAPQTIEMEVVTTRAALAKSARALARARKQSGRIAIVLVGDAERGGLVDAPAGVALAADAEAERASYWSFARADAPAAEAALFETPAPKKGAQGKRAADALGFEDALQELSALLGADEAKRAGAAKRARTKSAAKRARASGWLARNSKRVQTLFAEQGAPLPLPVFDVELAAFLVEPSGQREVALLAAQWTDRAHRSWSELAGRGAKEKRAAELPLDEVAAWAGAEACALLALEPKLRARCEADGSAALFEDVELPLTAVLSQMERAGVRVDEAKLAELSQEYTRELTRLRRRIHKLAGEEFLIHSPKQLQSVLFDKLGLTPIKKTKTGYSTDESVLEQLSLQHKLPAEILAYRRLAKLKSTYVDALPPLVDERSGRIHPTFNQVGAATGRLSSQHPNVQNIPIRTPEGARIREAFIPAAGRVLLSADYSQVELRVMAHYSDDENLLAAFAEGADIHRRTAAEVHGIAPEEVSAEQRAGAKAINFGIIYGSSAFGIAAQLGIPQPEAQRLITRYFERYRGVRRFLDRTCEAAREAGFVQTLLGRRRYIPDLNSRNRALRQAAERAATNTVIQGSAADLIKRAMVRVAAALARASFEAQLILQVHDELVFEVRARDAKKLGALVREEMENVYELKVPLVVELGQGENWRAAH